MWEGPTIAGNAIPWQVCQGWVKNGSRASYQQTVFLHGPRSSACFQRPVLSFRPDFPQRWTVTRKRKAEINPFLRRLPWIAVFVAATHSKIEDAEKERQ